MLTKELFEFFLKMEASGEPCAFKVLCDTIKEHTGLELSNFIHEGMFDSYEARWVGDWKQVLRDLVCYLPLLLAGKSAQYPHLLGMTWLDLQNSEWDHLLDLFIKKKAVGDLRPQESLSTIMIEACKCAAIDALSHERGERRDHAVKLKYKHQLYYNFDGAEITSFKQWTKKKEIMLLLFVLENHDLLKSKNKGLEPEWSWRAVQAIFWFITGVVLSDIHQGTDNEWRSVKSIRRDIINQALLYLYKSMSKNPNPNGERLSEIIPIRKSGVHQHHTNNYKYDIPPAQLHRYPTKYMISELIRGECTALLAGDHFGVTGYEKKWWKKVPRWMKKLSRFQHNY